MHSGPARWIDSHVSFTHSNLLERSGSFKNLEENRHWGWEVLEVVSLPACVGWGQSLGRGLVDHSGAGAPCGPVSTGDSLQVISSGWLWSPQDSRAHESTALLALMFVQSSKWVPTSICSLG